MCVCVCLLQMIAAIPFIAQFCSGQVITTIILNSSSLLRKDLPGINVLVPYFLTALELILPKSSNPFQ